MRLFLVASARTSASLRMVFALSAASAFLVLAARINTNQAIRNPTIRAPITLTIMMMSVSCIDNYLLVKKNKPARILTDYLNPLVMGGDAGFFFLPSPRNTAGIAA